MARGRIDDAERRQWNHTSHLLAAIANAIGGGKVKPGDVNPYRQPADTGNGEKEHVSFLKDLFGGAKEADG